MPKTSLAMRLAVIEMRLSVWPIAPRDLAVRNRVSDKLNKLLAKGRHYVQRSA